MIIQNGFIKLFSGDWINMSKIFAFTCESLYCDCKEPKYIIRGIIDPTDPEAVVIIDAGEYDTKKEAQEILDFHMTRGKWV